MVIEMDKELKNGKMVRSMKETGLTIKQMGKVSTFGLIKDHMMENGNKICYMDKAHTHGLMVESTQAHTFLTKNMVKEFTHGLMVNLIMVIGKTVYKMEKVNSRILNNKVGKEHGKMERGWLGMVKSLRMIINLLVL